MADDARMVEARSYLSDHADELSAHYSIIEDLVARMPTNGYA